MNIWLGQTQERKGNLAFGNFLHGKSADYTNPTDEIEPCVLVYGKEECYFRVHSSTDSNTMDHWKLSFLGMKYCSIVGQRFYT